MTNHITWSLIDQIAEEMGATKAARLKWRQRGVPPSWQVSIMKRLMEKGVAVSFNDFDDLSGKGAVA